MRTIKIALLSLALPLIFTGFLSLAKTAMAAVCEAGDPSYPACLYGTEEPVSQDPCVISPTSYECKAAQDSAARIEAQKQLQLQLRAKQLQEQQSGAAKPAASQPAPQPAAPSVKAPDASVELPNPLGNTYDPRTILGNIIQGVLGLIGSIALMLFVWGGFEIMLSRGGAGVKKGQDTMVWAAIGLAVVFGSYAITSYIINKITNQ